MRLARTCTAIIQGVDAHLIDVEAHLADGLPSIHITGLGDEAVRQAKERVRAALETTGFQWPQRRITVGLSPAWLHKRGSALDLAIALAVLAADHKLPGEFLESACVIGELGLDGRVRSVRGALPVALAAKRAGIRRIIVPLHNVEEAALVPELAVVGVASLGHCLRLLGVDCDFGSDEAPIDERPASQYTAPDLAEVRGQHAAKFALEVAAAGGHHVALLGPPGVGKTLLAERLPTILPALDLQAALEVTAIHSVTHDLVDGLLTTPPFAAPHHGASPAAVIGGGGGRVPNVGAISVAHRGVLFMDEAPEFARNVLDALRQPLETGSITIMRSGFAVTLPARFQLVIAANPCPCGHAFDRSGRCTCTPTARHKYLAKLSGPLMDRIDVRVIVEAPAAADVAIGSSLPGEPSRAVAERVLAARERQRRRLRDTGWLTNAEVPGPVLRRDWTLTAAAAEYLNDHLRRGAVASVRGADRTLRLAWTCADLAGRDLPDTEDVMLAMRLRDAGGRWAA